MNINQRGDVMKKTLIRIIPLLLGAAISVSCSSMYTSKPDKKENIVGLYELDVYKSKKESSEEEPYDRKAEEGIVAYFTIDLDGYGYYGYKDNITEARVDQVFSTFIEDDDEPGLYKAISMVGTSKTVYNWEKKVGCLAEPTMGFNRSGDIATLSYTIPWYEYTIYNPHKIQKYQYVSYKKISDETGYEAINNLLGTSFVPTKPYEMKEMRAGYYPYRCSTKEEAHIGPKGIYEYALLDMNNISGNKLNIIYSEVSDPGQKTTQVEFDVEVKGKSVSFKFHDRWFISSIAGFSTDFLEDADISSESFTSWYQPELSLEEVIELEVKYPS